jgi:hypothetical protein
MEQSCHDRLFRHRQPHPLKTARGLVNALIARPRDLGAEILDYQKMRGSRKIITIRVDQMHPAVQRIIVLRLILGMALINRGPLSVSGTLCPSCRGPS